MFKIFDGLELSEEEVAAINKFSGVDHVEYLAPGVIGAHVEPIEAEEL